MNVRIEKKVTSRVAVSGAFTSFACPTISEKNKGENAESTESKDLYKK